MNELMVCGFILTATATATAASEQDAYRNASMAFYKQSGLEQTVDAYVQEKLKDVPDPVKRTVSNTYLIVKSIKEQKVVYSWTF